MPGNSVVAGVLQSVVYPALQVRCPATGGGMMPPPFGRIPRRAQAFEPERSRPRARSLEFGVGRSRCGGPRALLELKTCTPLIKAARLTWH